MTSALCDALFARNVCGLPRENDVRCLIIHSRAKVSVNEPLMRKYLQIFRFSSILCAIVSFLILQFNFNLSQCIPYTYILHVYPYTYTLLFLFIYSFSLFFLENFDNFVIFLTFFQWGKQNRRKISVSPTFCIEAILYPKIHWTMSSVIMLGNAVQRR